MLTMSSISLEHYVDVILPLPLDKRFTYRLSPEDSAVVRRGMRVAVPFGKSKIYTGIVARVHNQAPLHYEAKFIDQVLDQDILVTHEQLEFWEWISRYYMCHEGEVLRAAVPSAYLLESETIVQLLHDTQVHERDLTDEEFLIYEALQQQSVLKLEEIIQILDKKKVMPIVMALVEKKVVAVNQEIYEQYKPKLERYVRLEKVYQGQDKLNELLDSLSRAHKQQEVIFSLFTMQARDKKPVKATALAKQSNASASVVKTLIDKGVLEEYYLQTDRIQFEDGDTQDSLQLNVYQLTAFEEIKSSFENQSVCLLHGITSSGKTEIYVKLIEEVLSQDKQVLYLLPEIALTTQLISRLRHYFGGKLSVYHSKYSVNERVEVYQNVLNKSGNAQLIIGVRSSIFLPFQDLGLIIVDEEHESSFKQYDPAPRYHARDAAIYLGAQSSSKVLLGTATPSLETYFNAQQNKYGLVTLEHRHGNVLPPEIEIVDLKDQSKKRKMTGHFSERLLEEIRETLELGEQVILFQNRRGYSPILECMTCGHSPQCPNCDVSLTFHSRRNQLRCHYCGYHMAIQQKCLTCGSHELNTKGFGTEQVETELEALFPEHKIGRMDLDTTRGKYGYEKIINAFQTMEIDILVGTQMLTKGLDFRNVRLVGIMNADSLLNFPDFRAHERSFQLMLQVAGRAGRTRKRGKVLIQAYNPYHQIIQQVSTHDYLQMYKEQLEDRRNYKYPPVYRLIRFTVRCRDYSLTNESADWLARSLAAVFKKNLLGPEFPPIARIRNEYHKNILLKIPAGQPLGKTKEAADRILKSFESIAAFRRVRVVVNVDPY